VVNAVWGLLFTVVYLNSVVFMQTALPHNRIQCHYSCLHVSVNSVCRH